MTDSSEIGSVPQLKKALGILGDPEHANDRYCLGHAIAIAFCQATGPLREAIRKIVQSGHPDPISKAEHVRSIITDALARGQGG
jgi:hypothetical protein